ncbi:hypothetical protein AOCH_000640, partial [Aspergillus ochraceoroseus]
LLLLLLLSQPVVTPLRTASPFQPPPLTPLTLTGDTANLQQQLLTRALAEEIRLLVPARLQLVDTWRLAYSLDRDGASLSTLYENCRDISHRSPRAGYVLVIRDSSPPPAPRVFPLARQRAVAAAAAAATVAPPHGRIPLRGRLLRESRPPSSPERRHNPRRTLHDPPQRQVSHPARYAIAQTNGRSSGTSTPDRIRFKAFPYSGVNDYMMFCETGFLSLGGGDGHYGLWLDSSIEKGVSQACQTFGNEPLSDEGVKFDVIGTEVWYVGA